MYNYEDFKEVADMSTLELMFRIDLSTDVLYKVLDEQVKIEDGEYYVYGPEKTKDGNPKLNRDLSVFKDMKMFLSAIHNSYNYICELHKKLDSRIIVNGRTESLIDDAKKMDLRLEIQKLKELNMYRFEEEKKVVTRSTRTRFDKRSLNKISLEGEGVYVQRSRF